jgi:flavin reductase (DIM6/NTAB) family NADH-FMN oxidoreductase RutF
MPVSQPRDSNAGEPMTARQLRDGFGTFVTGVAVVTASRPDGEPVGITVNSLTSVSLEPPLILWCLDKRSASTSAFAPSARFAVHILAHGQKDLAMQFAGRGRNKWVCVPSALADAQPPCIAGVLCRMECQVVEVHPGGDHWIIVGSVLAIQRQSGMPLIFAGGRFGVIKCDSERYSPDIWNALHPEWTWAEC